MGKKIPMDIAQKIAKTKNNESIFNYINPYGYKINVNHPKIRPLYEKCKLKLNIVIMSDRQRYDFESVIIKKIEKGELKIE